MGVWREGQEEGSFMASEDLHLGLGAVSLPFDRQTSNTSLTRLELLDGFMYTLEGEAR